MQKTLSEILRVNQAGEAGAVRIYQGQEAVLRDTSLGPTITYMKEQEAVHRDLFDGLSQAHHVKPTVFTPLWHMAGYAMGYGSALLGQRAAMACTVAVEEVIDAHYHAQLKELQGKDGMESVRNVIAQCHAEELEHRDIGLANEASQMRGYVPFTALVKGVSKLAIFLSKRL